MSANRDEILRQFCDVTGVDETRSRFFLDSSNWQLEIALSSFYEHGGNVDEAPVNPPSTASALPYLSGSDMESPPGSPVQPKKKEKKKSANTKFATLDSLQQDSSSDEEEGQAFYAGGSERSGQQILGPGKGRKDIVAEMFKSVRERGAVVFEDEPSTTQGRGGTFGGAGYRLGQTADDHEKVTANTPAQQQPEEERARLVRLHLYREGFTVDNGQIRPYADPDNAEFLNCIRRGKIPLELSAGGGEVRVSMEDRRQQEYVPAAHKPPPFAGKGHLLGSPTPATVGEPSAAPEPEPAQRAATLRLAQDAVQLDEASPVTTVQFRLSDGRRLTGRFNHSHTVGTLTAYLRAAEPQYCRADLTLATTFPSTELTDPEATLAQANLLNSTVMIRIK